MKRALKWIVPLVVVVEVILVWSGVADPGDAVLVVAGLEAVIFLVGLGGLVLVVGRYRKQRHAGLDPWRALEDGLSLVLPRAAARFVLHEPRMFVSLFRWAFRRVRPAEGEFGYHRRSVLRAIVPVVIVTSPLELLIVHLLAQALSPWGWLKWALLALGVYAVLWLLGLYASFVALPHRLERTGLRLRHGVLAEGFVPYEAIETVLRKEGKVPHFGDGLSHDTGEDALYLATGGKTDVALSLRAPRSVRGFLKETKPASRIHLAVDAPAGFVRELCSRIETPAFDSVAALPARGKRKPVGDRKQRARAPQPHGGITTNPRKGGVAWTWKHCSSRSTRWWTTGSKRPVVGPPDVVLAGRRCSRTARSSPLRSFHSGPLPQRARLLQVRRRPPPGLLPRSSEPRPTQPPYPRPRTHNARLATGSGLCARRRLGGLPRAGHHPHPGRSEGPRPPQRPVCRTSDLRPERLQNRVGLRFQGGPLREPRGCRHRLRFGPANCDERPIGEFLVASGGHDAFSWPTKDSPRYSGNGDG